jgi:polysaccharide pyruvyl transferase WcaK-like protein
MVQTSPEDIPPFEGYASVVIEQRVFHAFMHEFAWREQLRWISLLGNARCAYIIGADTVDDAYSRSQSNAKMIAMVLSGKVGVPTRLISFSVNAISEDLSKRMKSLPSCVRLLPRDPVSFQRLKEAGIDEVTLASDLSFLVEPDDVILDGQLLNFIKSNDRDIVGINFNNRMLPRDVDIEERTRYLANALYRFAKSMKVRLLFIPNTRLQSDKYFGALQTTLDKMEAGLVCIVDPIPSPGQLKRIISSCSYLFSVSLHLSLFALSMKVPVTCFPYVGKFEGTLREFGIADSQISIERLPSTADELSDELAQHYEQRDARKASIARNLERVSGLATKNFFASDVM